MFEDGEKNKIINIKILIFLEHQQSSDDSSSSVAVYSFLEQYLVSLCYSNQTSKAFQLLSDNQSKF